MDDDIDPSVLEVLRNEEAGHGYDTMTDEPDDGSLFFRLYPPGKQLMRRRKQKLRTYVICVEGYAFWAAYTLMPVLADIAELEWLGHDLHPAKSFGGFANGAAVNRQAVSDALRAARLNGIKVLRINHAV